MTADSDTATVLVVDDEEDIAELYTAWLRTEYDVRTAFDGEDALETVGPAVDIVFLDRQMPGKSGDEVLDALEERGLDCRVVMVTAVDPDFDIVDMPFDDYLTKPVTRGDLFDAVDEMLTRDSYDEQIQAYFAMASKKATLESAKNTTELDAHEEYTEISQRVEELRKQADSAVEELDDFETAFRELPNE